MHYCTGGRIPRHQCFRLPMAATQPISPNPPSLCFGAFKLYPVSGELRKAGALIKLQPQPFRLLLLLVERAGTVVTREEIRRCLWSDSTFVDFEHGINFSINQIRAALADNAEEPRYIETLPRRGYRFIATLSTPGVAEITAEMIPSPASPIPLNPGPAASIRATDLAIMPAAKATTPRRIAWLAAFLAILILVAALRYHYRLPSSSLLPDLTLRQLTINSSDDPVKSGALSPDGKYLAFSDASGMHVKLIATGETQPIPLPEGLMHDDVVWEIPSAGWFPDSTRFLANSHPAFEDKNAWSSASSSAWVVSILGTVPRKLHEHGMSWSVSPDGASVALSTNKGKFGEREIWLTGPNGEQPRRLFEVGEANGICCLRFLPDTRRISYVLTGESGDTLLARDVEGGPVNILLPPSELKKMGDFSFLPDGRLLYSDPAIEYITAFNTPVNYWTERLNPRTGQLIEEPTRLTNWAGAEINNSSVSSDGKRVAFLKSSGHGVAYLAELAPGAGKILNSRRFSREEGGEDAIGTWTLDGNAAIVVENRGDRYAIYKQALNSDTLVPIVAATVGWLNEEVVPTPDGKWLMVQNWPVGGKESVQILRVPLTGGVPEVMSRVREGSAIACSRPPSKLCAVAELSDDHKEMIVRSLDPTTLNPADARGAELARIELYPNYDAEQSMLHMDLSPDGSRLATVLSPNGPIAIRSLNNLHTELIRTSEPIRLVRWAADGKGLVVSSFIQGGSQIVHVELASKASTLLWKCDGHNCFALPSPDGHHLAIYTWKRNANIWMMENF